MSGGCQHQLELRIIYRCANFIILVLVSRNFDGVNSKNFFIKIQSVYNRLAGLDIIFVHFGGARGVMFIVVGNGHGNTSSNPG